MSTIDGAIVVDAPSPRRQRPPTLDEIAAKLALHRYAFAAEEALQRGIEQVLAKAGWAHEREVILSPRDRIDFLVGDVGIEVKVAGSTTDVLAQMARYAKHERIGALLLVTSLQRHTRAGFPATFNGKPAGALTLGRF